MRLTAGEKPDDNTMLQTIRYGVSPNDDRESGLCDVLTDQTLRQSRPSGRSGLRDRLRRPPTPQDGALACVI